MIIEFTTVFEPVEDKPGYYWLNRRNHQIISEEKLKELLSKEISKDIELSLKEIK